MMICCVNGPKGLKDVSVKIDKTEKGVTISVTSDKSETAEVIKKMVDCCSDTSESDCC